MEEGSIKRVADSAKHCGVSIRQFFNLRQNDPDFPPAIRLGGKAKGWKLSDLDAWLERQRIQK